MVEICIQSFSRNNAVQADSVSKFRAAPRSERLQKFFRALFAEILTHVSPNSSRTLRSASEQANRTRPLRLKSAALRRSKPFGSSCAEAARGIKQPPSSSASNRRSARTARRVRGIVERGKQLKGREVEAAAFDPQRSLTDGGQKRRRTKPLGHVRVQAEPLQSGFGKHHGIERAVECLIEPRFNVAAQRLDDQIGSAVQQLGLSAQRRRVSARQPAADAAAAAGAPDAHDGDVDDGWAVAHAPAADDEGAGAAEWAATALVPAAVAAVAPPPLPDDVGVDAWLDSVGGAAAAAAAAEPLSVHRTLARGAHAPAVPRPAAAWAAEGLALTFDGYRRLLADLGLTSVGRAPLPARAVTEAFLASSAAPGLLAAAPPAALGGGAAVLCKSGRVVPG